jgi:hypothetical protein
MARSNERPIFVAEADRVGTLRRNCRGNLQKLLRRIEWAAVGNYEVSATPLDASMVRRSPGAARKVLPLRCQRRRSRVGLRIDSPASRRIASHPVIPCVTQTKAEARAGLLTLPNVSPEWIERRLAGAVQDVVGIEGGVVSGC